MWEKREGSLAEQIRWADAHPEELVATGERARQRVREHYTWDGVAEAHDRYFRQLARKHGLRGI